MPLSLRMSRSLRVYALQGCFSRSLQSCGRSADGTRAKGFDHLDMLGTGKLNRARRPPENPVGIFMIVLNCNLK